MSRPQEFDTDTALDAAINVFWERGVHRASIDDLLHASGLSRSSLYNRFGSKEALFALAVDRYVKNQVVRLQCILQASSFRAAIQELFYSAVTSNHDGRGCLLVNCAGSLMDSDDNEQHLLRSGFERMFSLLEQRITQGQVNGELPKAIDPVSAATLICATLSGLRIFHKAGLRAERLEGAVELAVQHIFSQFDGVADSAV